VGGGAPVDVARSLTADAWYDLRRNPIFWVAASVVLVMVTMAIAPGLFSRVDPRTASCELADSLKTPSAEHWFGFNKQGCDIYSRVVYGARSSIIVGIFSTLLSGAIALVVGLAAGFYGRWIDAVLARVTDIFLSIPLFLAAVVVAKALASQDLGIWSVVIALGIFAWPSPARLVRSSVISVKEQDYVQAARVLGAGDMRIMARHILPNALAPVIVVLMIGLGTVIATEATLSFMGVGPKNTISWGVDIADAQIWIREAAFPLMFPAGFLTTTVLAFIMLGDAVREAFDPRLR